MKKIILLLAVLISFTAMQNSAQAQTGNPWDGPRWTSVKVTQTVWQWIEDNGIMPELTDTNGEWVDTDYTYLGSGTWMVVITWGTGSFGGPELGSETLLIKNNGRIIG